MFEDKYREVWIKAYEERCVPGKVTIRGSYSWDMPEDKIISDEMMGHVIGADTDVAGVFVAGGSRYFGTLIGWAENLYNGDADEWEFRVGTGNFGDIKRNEISNHEIVEGRKRKSVPVTVDASDLEAYLNDFGDYSSMNRATEAKACMERALKAARAERSAR